jgi:hypothetical protein
MPSTSATDGFQLREAIHSHRILRGKGLRRLLPVGTLAGLVLVLVTSVSALRLSGQSENPLRESQKSATGAGVISLDFRPLPMEELKIGEPQDHWLKAKTVEFCAVRKVKDGDRRQERAIIHLFIDANDKGVDRADVYAFLDDHSTLYDLGNVSAYGVTGVQVDTADLTNWETKEIVLSGGLGAACGFAEVLAGE